MENIHWHISSPSHAVSQQADGTALSLEKAKMVS
jgi:hypothetical protein